MAILKWEQPVTYRQYLERVVLYLNKIKFIYKYDTHFEIFFLSWLWSCWQTPPTALWEGLLCSLGHEGNWNDVSLFTERDIEEPRDSGLAVTLPDSPAAHNKWGLVWTKPPSPTGFSKENHLLFPQRCWSRTGDPGLGWLPPKFCRWLELAVNNQVFH